MELHARLVHAETGRRVVEVRATRGERRLGSALAEAATAQEAEDLAVTRLLQRLEATAPAGAAEREHLAAADAATPVSAAGVSEFSGAHGAAPGGEPARPLAPPPAPVRRQVVVSPQEPAPRVAAAPPPAKPAQQHARTDPNAPLPSPWDTPSPPPTATAETAASRSPQEPVAAGGSGGREPRGAAHLDPEQEPPVDPEDWSQELTALDLQLRRLGWGREEEGSYLLRAFGHPSRSRLTRYSDLRAYLTALEGLERGSDPAVAPVPLRRSDLLTQGDALLAQLGWSPEQGRAFLERELQRHSRQQLSDVQLLQFNMLLEGELLAAGNSSLQAG